MLVMRPCHDEYGSGLEIDFHATSLEDIIQGVFVNPGELQDCIALMCRKQGMREKQIWEIVPNIFNQTRDYIKNEFIKQVTPHDRAMMGLTF